MVRAAQRHPPPLTFCAEPLFSIGTGTGVHYYRTSGLRLEVWSFLVSTAYCRLRSLTVAYAPVSTDTHRPLDFRSLAATLPAMDSISEQHGLDGEQHVWNLLREGLPPEYVVLRNLLIPDLGIPDLYAQIDCLVLYTSGIYVVEVKSYRAFIVGRPSDPYWTAIYHSGFHYNLQNPLRQNENHVFAVSSCLGLDASDGLVSLVVFTRYGTLPDSRPPSLLYSGELVPFILSRSDLHVFDASDIPRFSDSLLTLASSIPDSVRALYGKNAPQPPCEPLCPKCGAVMVHKFRNSDHVPFWGCPNWRPDGSGCNGSLSHYPPNH